MAEYALYKGDEFLCIGTAKEIAKNQNVSTQTVMFYATDAYKRKLAKRKSTTNARILIKLDDDENEDEI